jgi:predicted nucleotidyltransferase
LSAKYDGGRLAYLENYMETAREVKRIVVGIDPSAQTYVFGSVVKGRFTAASDIDILIVSRRPDLEYQIKTSVYKTIQAPVEVHFSSPEQLTGWYRRFIGEDEMRLV